ncbi:hypothetical protein [Heyndrickxia coagulans]|nr:hypothetical protein [Heyndrickxia coagulans]
MLTYRRGGDWKFTSRQRPQLDKKKSGGRLPVGLWIRKSRRWTKMQRVLPKAKNRQLNAGFLLSLNGKYENKFSFHIEFCCFFLPDGCKMDKDIGDVLE